MRIREEINLDLLSVEMKNATVCKDGVAQITKVESSSSSLIEIENEVVDIHAVYHAEHDPTNKTFTSTIELLAGKLQ